LYERLCVPFIPTDGFGFVRVLGEAFEEIKKSEVGMGEGAGKAGQRGVGWGSSSVCGQLVKECMEDWKEQSLPDLDRIGEISVAAWRKPEAGK